MSAYTPNSYRVTLFDRIGTKIKTLTADSFTTGKDVGEQEISRAEAHSFAVSRVLYNSLMPRVENYDVKTTRY